MSPTLESLGIDRLSVAVRVELAEAIRDSVAALTRDVAALKANRPATLVSIQTFAPEPYDLLRPLSVAVQPADDEFWPASPTPTCPRLASTSSRPLNT